MELILSPLRGFGCGCGTDPGLRQGLYSCAALRRVMRRRSSTRCDSKTTLEFKRPFRELMVDLGNANLTPQWKRFRVGNDESCTLRKSWHSIRLERLRTVLERVRRTTRFPKKHLTQSTLADTLCRSTDNLVVIGRPEISRVLEPNPEN